MRTIITGLVACLLVLGSLPSSANEPALMAIVPDHVGLTVKKSPVLYFYISHATSYPVRFTLVDVRQPSPVAEVLLPSPTRAGFVAIRLEDHQIVLEEDVQYKWFVSVMLDPNSHASDIVAGGAIERVDPILVNYYGRSCDKDAVRLLGEAGVWYDAVACLCDLIRSSPDDETLRRWLHKLLGQRPGLYLLNPN